MAETQQTTTTPPSPPAAKGDAQAIIDALTELAGCTKINLDEQHHAVVVPRGMKIESLKPLLDQYRVAPERRRGTAQVNDLGSFVRLVNRFADAHSLLFADPATPRLLAVLDYHEQGAAGAARWGQHRVVYDFPLAAEWRAWRDRDGNKMSQGDFAEFLEDRIVDVLPPPGAADLTDARFPGIAEFARLLGATWADPQRLVALARGLQVNVAAKVKDARNLATGEAQIVFESEHRDATGAPLKVPQLFLVGLPVFDRGPVYRLAVRLRYRVAGPAINWLFELWRPELAFQHAIDEACDAAAQETGLLLLRGTPEA